MRDAFKDVWQRAVYVGELLLVCVAHLEGELVV